MLKIAKNNLPALFRKINETKEVYLPIRTAEQVNFGVYTEGCDVALETLKTVKSPKDAFFPQSETLYTCQREGKAIREQIPAGSYVIAMCIEGKPMSSTELAQTVKKAENTGKSKLCVLIGGSEGLEESLKQEADLRLSMSPMTFPHHLARVMVLEQLYRAEAIQAGSKYHK